MTAKQNTNLIPLAIVVAGICIGFAIFSSGPMGLSSEEAGEKAIDFINKNMLPAETPASLVSINEESGIYKFMLEIEGEQYPSYITKDGKLLFPEEGISLGSLEEEAVVELSPREKPDVKLFVMSYCPYGLQAQKMFLPVYDLLKNEADIGVYFVDYIMHGKEEIDENLRQYCIQKEEKEKYYDYLSCFVQDGDFENCLARANIDTDKMGSCVSQTDQTYKITELYEDESTWLSGYYPQFNVQTDLNEQYGVGGSPTIVINDQLVELGDRSPEKFKELVCRAFNTPPEACSQTLSEEVFTPGLGLDTGSSSGGSCE